MAAASSSSSRSSSAIRCQYDVFLNFRGEDTRKIFIGHLYKALDQKAIRTFMDSDELRKGNDLSQLLAAINNSRLSIVVFSANYASSSWCLKELVQIMDCMEKVKQIVVPVFYDVDPSDIRKLKRNFAEAFAKHECDSNGGRDEAQRWRLALKRATNLSGWDSRNYPDDAKLIEDIVDDIFSKLIHISSSKDNGLIGMDSHIRQMNLLLLPKPEPAPEMDGVRVVGIWGMGGIGKTTIARAVYDRIACRFEGCCFLQDVKEGFSKNGVVQMQEQLLSMIFKEKMKNSGTLNRGSNVLMERLGRKKVLLVLDDVDNLAQIEALIGMQYSLVGGWRIIITTRDKQLLSGVDAIYTPNILTDSKALRLFKQYAFKTHRPTQEFNPLSRRAIQYAQGLPLALKVLGAFLDNKSVSEWQDVLERLKKIPQQGIHDVLRTSFYGLHDLEKEIFLDIACFLRGMEKDHAVKILDGCGSFPHSGLRVLVNRALITVSNGKLEMHDLLAEMGREIVRQESTKEPGRRSRLWCYEDVYRVLTQNTATEAVESIIMDFSLSKVEYLSAEVFHRMKKLRLLKIHYRIDSDVRDLSCEDLDFLSDELRCLLWHGCPLKILPSNFCPMNLVHLGMQESWIEQLWEGIKQPLENLDYINLSWSMHLKKTPDFTWATNLKEIILDNCTCLFEVHPSISALQNLVLLSLKGCHKLTIFPRKIGMKSLKTLHLSGCVSLDNFPEITEVMKELSELYLDWTSIKCLPSSISNLLGVATLKLKDCRQLKSLPSNIWKKSLKTLDLSGCSNLLKLPEISEVMVNLDDTLDLAGTAIHELPSSIDNLVSITSLHLKDCVQLKSLPSSIFKMRFLTSITLSGCSNLDNFPEVLDTDSQISDLSLDGTAIKQLPSSIQNLRCLRTLNLRGCRELKNLPSSICRLKSLAKVTLSGCTKLEAFPDIVENMENLTELELDGTSIKELCPSIERLQGLVLLNLKNCKSLVRLPENMCNLKRLKRLNIYGCPISSKLPEHLRKLQSVDVAVMCEFGLDKEGKRNGELVYAPTTLLD